MAKRWQEQISVGFQVFAQGGEEEFGAVRDVCQICCGDSSSFETDGDA
jgi:hypothetical protein